VDYFCTPMNNMPYLVCGHLQGYISKDHIPLFVSIPLQVTIVGLCKKLKVKSSYKLFQTFELLRRQYWGRLLWARGYFCCSSGNVTNEVSKSYIKQQKQDDRGGLHCLDWRERFFSLFWSSQPGNSPRSRFALLNAAAYRTCQGRIAALSIAHYFDRYR
jgi:putative transposase